jgi:endonuclease/exonuclease/phosphatase family metal-dependent hydrolase
LIRALHILLSFFSRTANIIAFFLLLISTAAFYINPDYFWPLALFGLAYPIFLVLNIFFLFSWVMRRRWFFLLSFLGIVASYPQLKGQIAFGRQEQVGEEANSIRVMSFNVRNFDLYNWTGRDGSRKSMFDTIASVNPDILCMQEFFTDTVRFPNLEALSEMGYHYHSMAIELTKAGHRRWGITIVSKYPIVEEGELIRQQRPTPYGRFPNRAVFADVKVGSQIIRVISTHLQSIHLNLEDYETIKELPEDSTPEWKKYQGIIFKLAKAFEHRGVQTVELEEFISSTPYPVVLCGDFNDTPSSYTYGSISRLLNDAFLQAGKGIGATYNGVVPFLRIDYIFTSPDIHCARFEINGNPHSDHFPIVADLLLPDGNSEKK